MKLISLVILQTLSLMTQIINCHLVRGNSNPEQLSMLENLSSNKVKKSVAVKDKNQLWTSGIVYYEIEDIFSVSQRKLIKQGMRKWEEVSCVRFIERNPEVHRNFVAITKLNCGCCYIEKNQRNKGRSELSLADSCYELPIILHELGHVLGFYHEHLHPDRDQYIKIIRQNIEPGYEEEFWKYSPADVDTLGAPYDYQSIMHYKRNAYAYYDFWSTIVPKRSNNGKIKKIGHTTELSDGDIKAVNILYNCPVCGGTIYSRSGIIEPPPLSSYDLQTQVQHCEWRIVAGKGEEISFGIVTNNIHQSPNCMADYIEIRNGYYTNNTLLGRYCGTNRNLISHLTGDNAVITYVRSTNLTDRNVGFKLYHVAICGKNDAIVVNKTNSYILKSPNFPDDAYEPFTDCSWEFKAPDNYKIKVKFIYFNLGNSPNCNDNVEIEAVTKSKSSSIIGRYCGNVNPREVDTNISNIFIKFISEDIQTSVGFSAKIYAEPINYN